MDSTDHIGPDLPGEIIENIIDHLRPSYNMLKSLSLISRAWFPWARCRDHQFTSIQLDGRNFLDFLRLLQSPQCTLPRYVCQLHIEWGLDNLPKLDREVLLDVLTLPHPWLDPNTYNYPKSLFRKVKLPASHKKSAIMQCHVMNLVCLFPSLECLQVQLMAMKSSVPEFNTLPRPSPTLKSLSVICNTSPPHPKSAAQPPEWKHFLKWVRRNQVYGISSLYLTSLAPWNYEGASTLIDLQKPSLKHLHIAPQRSASQYADFLPPCKCIKLSLSVESLHHEITEVGMSRIAAEAVSALLPENLTNLVLETRLSVIRNVDELVHLKRLGKALRTRGFDNLRSITVKLEHNLSKQHFTEGVQILRGVFMRSILTVESWPLRNSEGLY